MITRVCWHCEKEFQTSDAARRFCCVRHWRAWKKNGEKTPRFMSGYLARRRFLIPGVDKAAPGASWRDNHRKRQRCGKCGETGHNARRCQKED